MPGSLTGIALSRKKEHQLKVMNFGKLFTNRNAETVEVCSLVMMNRKSTMKGFYDEVGMSVGSCQAIFTQD